MASAGEKGFRFSALPPELRVEIAEYLDLKPLKNLSLCSKAVREDAVSHCLPIHVSIPTSLQIKVLLKTIEMPDVYRPEPDPLSYPAMMAVQHFKLRYTIYKDNDKYLSRRRRSSELQFAILPYLTNLRRLDIEIDSIDERYYGTARTGTLEKPLPMFLAGIEAICNIHPRLAFGIKLHLRATELAMDMLLPPLFESLSRRKEKVTFLELGYLGEDWNGIVGIFPQLASLKLSCT